MASSTINLSGTKVRAAGTETLAFTQIANTTTPENTTVQAFLAATFAAVVVPAGANGVWIQPPSNNTGAITLKGITGDTGVALGKTNPFWLSLDSSSSFGLLCANAISITFEWT